jgi:hypothetical protein
MKSLLDLNWKEVRRRSRFCAAKVLRHVEDFMQGIFGIHELRKSFPMVNLYRERYSISRGLKMPIKFRTYVNDTKFGEDYYKLRYFLITLNDGSYHFGRWDWMITHPFLDEKGLDKIGIWEDNDEIVALATYDTNTNLKGVY